MAHVTLPDGRELDEPDGDPVLGYYRGIGATVDEAKPVTFPVVVVNGEQVDPPTPPVVAAEGEYDPGEHNVDDVNAYLADLDEQARERVFALERDGKARVGILDGPYAVFDPSAHNVDEVNTYLARDDVDDAERERVLDAERASDTPRKGILGDED